MARMGGGVTYKGAEECGISPEGALAQAVATVEGDRDLVGYGGVPVRGHDQLVALLHELDQVGVAILVGGGPYAGEVAGRVGPESELNAAG